MLTNLKKLREEKGLSQQKLAVFFDLTQQSIHKYETQDVEPDISTLKRMADYFDTSIDYLVGYTDIRHKIEPVTAFDLNKSELKLVEQYRLLSTKSRKIIDDLVSDILHNKQV